MKKKYDYALVSGGFDPVHVGHLRMFQDAKKLSDKVIVLLNNDDWLIKKKGLPFMNQKLRKNILEDFEILEDLGWFWYGFGRFWRFFRILGDFGCFCCFL